MKFDTEKIKSNNDIVTIVSKYIHLEPAGGSSFKALCPFHSEKTPSFVVNSEYQNYKCYGCGETGDIIRFVSEIENIDFVKACEMLDGTEVISTEKKQPVKTKKQAPKPAKWISLDIDTARKTYSDAEVLRLAKFTLKRDDLKISRMDPYKNADGLVDIVTVRFDHPGGKDVLTYYYDGKNVKMKGYPVLLMNRDQITAKPGAKIMIHEGEKCVEFASKAFPDAISTTWNGGGKKVRYIQGLDCLRGRDVYLFPDDDQKIDKRTGELLPPEKQPGLSTMLTLKKMLEEL